jgi:hypothetical protein
MGPSLTDDRREAKFCGPWDRRQWSHMRRSLVYKDGDGYRVMDIGINTSNLQSGHPNQNKIYVNCFVWVATHTCMDTLSVWVASDPNRCTQRKSIMI